MLVNDDVEVEVLWNEKHEDEDAKDGDAKDGDAKDRSDGDA